MAKFVLPSSKLPWYVSSQCHNCGYGKIQPNGWHYCKVLKKTLRMVFSCEHKVFWQDMSEEDQIEYLKQDRYKL